MISEDEERAPYDPVPDGAKALSRLVNVLGEDEFARFWAALGDVVRLSALAVHRYSQP